MALNAQVSERPMGQWFVSIGAMNWLIILFLMLLMVLTVIWR
jgi:hypothetical protein